MPKFFVAFFLSICAILSGCASLSLPASRQSCTPQFPLKDGWLGGDAAYSAPLPDSTSVWFFGDTYIARTKYETRANAAFISNSAAKSSCVNGEFRISYHWAGSRGAPEPLFKPKAKRIDYWPLSTFFHEGKLYVFLERVRRNSNRPFDFDITGVDLGRIDNPLSKPEDWSVAVLDFYRGNNAIPGVANVIDEHFVYLYTRTNRGDKHPIVLTRLPLDAVDHPVRALEYYALGKTWKSGLNRTDAVTVMENGATEMSVRHVQNEDRYIAVMPTPAALADYAVFRTAPTLFGPWSRPGKLFDYPELMKKRRGRTNKRYCYAAKEQPQFAAPDNSHIVVTYVCNSLDKRKLHDLSLYVPHSIVVALPFR